MSKSPNVQNGANARSSLSDSANGAMAHRRLLPRVLEGCSCHMRTRFVNFDSIETLQDVHFSLADVPVYVLDAPAGAKFAVASLAAWETALVCGSVRDVGSGRRPTSRGVIS